ncbi:hypothetical protein G6F63_014503 [Rhizopus arrhizus]|nr:hypothetical protein G6F63_014503 [Rhizopus arrhizus]
MVPWADAVPARARPAAANEVASNSGVDRNDVAHPCGRRKGAVTAGTALRGGLPAPPRRVSSRAAGCGTLDAPIRDCACEALPAGFTWG